MDNRRFDDQAASSAEGEASDPAIRALHDELSKTREDLELFRQKAAAIEGLEQEREMLHTLLDYSKDAIYFKDIKSRYLRISRAHPALQYIDSPEKAIGKTDFDYFPVEHAQEAFEDEMRIIATGEPILGIVEP